MWWIFFITFLPLGDSKPTDKFLIPLLAAPLKTVLGVQFENKCIEDLGCFYNGPPFYDIIYRPISMPPEDDFRTRYLLFTPKNTNNSYQLNLTEDSIGKAPIDSELLTVVLVHGFNVELNDNDSRFFQKMKDELFKTGSYNVIVIDWTEHSNVLYPQAVANSRVVGAQIAKLITLCEKKKNVQLKKVHIIGHSLGAHIAGWAGNRLKRLGRITGLDPAGPYFQNAPSPVRLDKTDADFVDVIHTNAGTHVIEGVGLEETVGDLDFYPNGGNHHPGCLVEEKREKEFGSYDHLIPNQCDHSRANEFFIDSINNCAFLSVHCHDYQKFKNGECNYQNSIVSKMGFHAQKLIGLQGTSKFFLHTSSHSPYCV